MRGRDLWRVAALGAVALAVAGCDTTVQETLGLGRRAPDEFQVVRRAPLVVPPDATLRPPGVGAPAAPRRDPALQARGILTGEERVPRPGSLSEAERALIASSPVRSEPGIRERIVAENAELARLDRRTFLWILNFQRDQFRSGAKDRVLDPAAEAARLRTGGGPAGDVVTVRTGSAPIAAP